MLGHYCQTEPWPAELERLVDDLAYRDGWSFALLEDYERDHAGTHGEASAGTTLVITISGKNSYPPHGAVSVAHLFAVPPSTWNAKGWRRWLFERIGDVELHERMEWFTLAGEKPYAPNHGPGEDPYILNELSSVGERSTSFRGELNPSRD